LPIKKLSTHGKFAVQFHQSLKLQISSLNWCTNNQICLQFAKHCAPKKGSHSVQAKRPQEFVDEIDPCSQFHQRFMHAFSYKILAPKISS